MTNAQGTYTCDHEGCCCTVADDETHPKSTDGKIYCSEGCKRAEGCSHSGCSCSAGA